MTDLYLAARSDNRSILKVGRSSCPIRRCKDLASGHCFEMRLIAMWPGAGRYELAVHRALEALRVPGSGREWFYAAPAEVYAAVALAMGGAPRERSRSPPRDPHGSTSPYGPSES
jgi:hypothetical protein